MIRAINCIIVDDEAIAREIIAMHLEKIDGIEVVSECSNAIDAFNAISKHNIDLVFLDINMPDISGIAFAKSINKNIKVIFTTAYRDYAVEGFELNAVDYVMKPISFDRLVQAINRFYDTNNDLLIKIKPTKKLKDFIFVRADRQMQKVDFTDILYIESYSDYIKIHCNDKTLITRETISNIEAKLPVEDFLRIHRSYIVALNAIKAFTNEFISLKDKSLTISRSYKSNVLKRLEKLS